MKYIWVFLFSFLLFFSSEAQVFKKKEYFHKLEVGLDIPEYQAFMHKGPQGKHYYRDYILQPQVSYYPLKFWGFGISGDINLAKSNFTDIKQKYGFGLFTRFYMPFKFTPKFFKKLDFFIELRYARTNYYWQKKEVLSEFEIENLGTIDFSEPVVLEKLKAQSIYIPIGLKYDVFDNLTFELSPMYVYDFHEKYEYLDLRTSVSYYFLTNKPKIEKTKKPKKNNTDFFNSFIIGSNLMYYNSKVYTQDNGKDHLFSFFLWNLNFAASLNESIFLGVQNFMFFTNDINNQKNNYNLTGIFAQFDFLRKSKNARIFFDLSINNGNILFDYDFGPVYRKNTPYAGFGFGFDFPLKRISEHLFLDLSGYRYVLLVNSSLGFSFNQYVIGLNYHFGKRVKQKNMPFNF